MKKIETKTFEFSGGGGVAAPPATSSITIDLVDACNLACATCPRGSRTMKNHRGQMPLGRFEQIISKAAALGFFYVGLYNWTEPFITKNLHEYTRLVKQYGMYCHLSSNLSFRKIPYLLETLENCDLLIVSLSGYTQPVYRINHRGGNIDFVKKQLEIIGTAKREGRINTRVNVRYFVFPHSAHEYEKFKEFGEALGLNVIAWQGNGDPVHADGARQKRWKGIHDGTWKIVRPPSLPEICYQSVSPFIVDMHGDSYLCCSQPNSASTRI